MAISILIFYHGLLFMGEPPEFLPQAAAIIEEQMAALKSSGLEAEATEIHVGLNGTEIESSELAQMLFPAKAQFVYHGLQCRNEVRSIVMLQERVRQLDTEAYCLYFHAKGSTHSDDQMRARWRACMMRNVVTNWRTCVRDLDAGSDAVGCHFMQPPKTPVGQYIFAGNFWFAKASFLKTLPSILVRDRIKISGIDSIESRYESEIILGLGPRLPIVRDYHPGWIDTCQP